MNTDYSWNNIVQTHETEVFAEKKKLFQWHFFLRNSKMHRFS
jgi:hypothetical protein